MICRYVGIMHARWPVIFIACNLLIYIYEYECTDIIFVMRSPVIGRRNASSCTVRIQSTDTL